MDRYSGSCIIIAGDAYGSFLMNEMPYLAMSFKKVFVFAYNPIKASSPRGYYPENVMVYVIGVAQGWQRLLEYIPRGLVRGNEDLAIRCWRIKRIVASLYARGRANAVYKKIRRMIVNDKSSASNGVIYSYWFTDHAIVAWRLKEWLNKQGGNFRAYSRAHGYDLYWERNRAGYLPFQDVSLAHLDGVCPCSLYGAMYLAEKYPAFAGKIGVARLGTCDYGLGPLPDGKQIIFVTCGRLSSEKRTRLFAEAFCLFLLTHPNCHWYCIGDGMERDEVEEIILRNSAASAVTMMGEIANAQIMDFYQKNAVDYFVNVSSSEGVPVSVMEAMSFGIPIIATDVGGTGELVDCDSGRLIAPDISSEKLRDVLLEMINLDNGTYKRTRRSARLKWESIASADKNYTQWSNLLLGN